MELRIRRRRPRETLAAPHQDIRRLIALAHPMLSSEVRETFAYDYFIDAMDGMELALKVRERTPASLDDALRTSQQLETLAKDARRGRHDDISATKQKVRGVDDAEGDAQQLNNRVKRIEGDIHHCLYGLHCLNGPGPGVGNPGTHPVTHPDANKGKPEMVAASKAFNKPRVNRPIKICWRCGLPSHLKRNCVHYTPQQPSFPGAQRYPDAVLCGSDGKDRDPRYLHMRLDGKTVVCLLYTGCDVTLVPHSVVSDTHGLKVTPCVEYIQAANGTQIAVTRKIILPFRLNGRHIKTCASHLI